MSFTLTRRSALKRVNYTSSLPFKAQVPPFRVLHFPVLYFCRGIVGPTFSDPVLSGPAFFGPAFWARFYLLHFLEITVCI